MTRNEKDRKMVNKFLSKTDVDGMTGISDVTRWRMEKRGDFPKRRQISPNRVAYLESEILEWMNTRPASSNEQGEAA